MSDSAVPITVLIVDSVNDDITQRRHSAIARSERLRHIRFDYCYAADLDSEQESQIRAHFLPYITIAEDDLVRRVTEAMQRSTPLFVLLHTGFLYRRNEDAFLRAFAKLKDATNGPQFGVQMRPGMTRDRNAFHATKAVLDIERLIFTEVLGNP